jgi:hypothetical protein
MSGKAANRERMGVEQQGVHFLTTLNDRDSSLARSRIHPS